MKRVLALTSLLVLSFAFAQEGSSVTATDLLGRTVSLPKPAVRVVPTNITALGQMLALGLEPAGTFCYGASPAVYLQRERNMPVPEKTPCISDAEGATDWEKVASLRPDLIIGWNQEEAAAAEVVAPFFGTQTDAVAGRGADSLEMYDKSLQGVAQLTDREAEAEAVLAATRDRIEAYADLAPDAVSVLHIGTFDGKEFWVFGQASLNCQLLSRIANCAAPDTSTDYYVSGSSEMILSLDPDVILLVNGLDGAYMDEGEASNTLNTMLDGDPLWSELRAVQTDRVQLLPHDTRASSVWGITDYLDTVAPLLYPDTFPEPLTDRDVQAARAQNE